MLKKMMIKEWRERSGVILFALAALALFAVAFTVYSRDKYALDVLAGTLVLIFLPVFSLLLGASGFSSEFRDGAWAYLFSRPARKWRLGLAKYLSLLTILLLVLFLFALLAKVHPALKPVPSVFNFPLLDERMPFGVLAVVIPLLLFTTAISLSVLSEHPLVVAFLTLLVWTVLPMAATVAGFGSLILGRGMFSSTFWLMFPLVPLSLFLAFLVTLNRSDFSQPRRRAWTFTKSAAIFILASIGFVTLFALGTNRFRREPYIYDLEARDNAFYFATEKGFFKFDLAEGKTGKVARHPSTWGQMSLGDDKVAFVTYRLSGKWRGFAQLRIMNSDGKDERPLVATEHQGSPLYGGFIHPLLISPRGDRVAFIVRYGPKTTAQDLWVINSDGSGLKGYDMGVHEAEYYVMAGFGKSDRVLFLLYTEKVRPGGQDRRTGARLVQVNLESGEVEILADKIRKPYAASMALEATASAAASEAGLIAYIQYDEATSREVLTVLNPETLEKQPVYPEDSVMAFHWNNLGDKLAFLTQTSKLGIYSVAENRIVQMRELRGYDLRWPTQALEWTTDGQIVLRRLEGDVSSICLLDASLTEQKAVRLPFDTHYASRIWSAGKYAIIEDTERHHLWALDLTTEKWLRIY